MTVLIILLGLFLVIPVSKTSDPCLIYENLIADYTRSPSHVEPVHGNKICDATLPEKWYRFVGDAGTDLTNNKSVLVDNGCGTHSQLWMNGSIPAESDGIVDRMICVVSVFSKCHTSFTVQVKNCCSFRVYNLKSANSCPSSYCVSPGKVPSVDCPSSSTYSTTSASTTTDDSSGNIASSTLPNAEATSPGEISSTAIYATDEETTTKVSFNIMSSTASGSTTEYDEVLTESESTTQPTIIVLIVICAVLLLLFIGLLFAMYMRHRRQKHLTDSSHTGNTAMHYTGDMNHAFTENTINVHYEQLQSRSQPDGVYQDISADHYSSINPRTEINDLYTISENQNQGNSQDGPYYVLNVSAVQPQASPYEELKSQTSSSPYDSLTQTASDSNQTSKSALTERDASTYYEI